MKALRILALTGLPLLMATLGCDKRGMKTCDITQRACQEDVYYRLLSLRGDGYDPFGGLPPVKVITEDDYRAQLMQDQAEAAKSGPSPWDTALGLLHFYGTSSTPAGDGGVAVDGGTGGDAGAATSSIDDEVTHTYAFYYPLDKTITIIAHPTQTGDHPLEMAMTTLAHELVHALQDRELDLGKRDFHTFDEYLAYKGIVEGDARFYEYLFTSDIRVMLGATPGDPLQWPDDELEASYAYFDQLGSPFFAARYLMYPLGAKYEAAAYRAGGNTAVRHAYAKAPQRTVGFLVGPDGLAPPVGTGDVCTPPAVSALPVDGDSVGADQFGAVPLYTFLRGWGVAHDVAFATAQSWTGDYLLVQADLGFSVTAVSWRLEFSAAPPASVVTALSTTRELSVKPGAKSIEITVSDSPTPLVWKATSNCP